ncbi:MAG: sigma-70 family RNA polymerase sigma factor [Clostridia bacterium]|nr:sigma-70 family RNA polymerase sigma factor [Clostridia bacterium]
MSDVLELIKKVRNGDQPAFDALSKHYSPLILSMTQIYSSLCEADDSEKEDVLQEAMVAFYHACLRYDLTEKNVSFGLYAKVCIRNRLISFLRRLPGQRHLTGVDGFEAQTDSRVPDPLEGVLQKEDVSRMMAIVNNELSPYEKKIFSLYMLGRTSDEIALSVGKTKKSVSNAIYRIRVKIKGLLS